MSETEGKLTSLPKEIRNLVSDGIYSLYSIPESEKFILVTDNREIYLIAENGEVERQLSEQDSFTLGNVISLTKEPSARTLKINYA